MFFFLCGLMIIKNMGEYLTALENIFKNNLANENSQK